MSIWSVFSSTGGSCFVCSNHADKLYCCASLAVHPLHGTHSWEWEWAMQTVCVRLAIHNWLRTKYWWQLSKPIKLILTRNNKSQQECYYLYLKYVVIIIKSQKINSDEEMKSAEIDRNKCTICTVGFHQDKQGKQYLPSKNLKKVFCCKVSHLFASITAILWSQ